ncbi:MAG: FAD-dependent oxidoreductase [Pirellulales bacterium]
MAKRIVVIGAGPGGLASAMQLAKAGAEVTVLEAQPHVGGRCSAIEAEGFRFDVGPTFFLYPRVLREIFASVGYDLDREVPMKRLDPQYRLTFGAGGMLDCTPDIAEMEKRIANLCPKDEGAITRYMRDNRINVRTFSPYIGIAVFKFARLGPSFGSSCGSLGSSMEKPRTRARKLF